MDFFLLVLNVLVVLSFERPGLVDDPLEQTPDGRFIQRPAVGGADILKDIGFALRDVNGSADGLLQASDDCCVHDALVQQLQDGAVEQVDAVAQVRNRRR